MSWELVVTVAIVVVGWLVSGTQRVNEELTSERRRTYGDLLCAEVGLSRTSKDGASREAPLIVGAENSSKASPTSTFRELATRARLISSGSMFKSGVIQAYEKAVIAETQNQSDIDKTRKALEAHARIECIYNSMILRGWFHRRYRPAPSGRPPSSGIDAKPLID